MTTKTRFTKATPCPVCSGYDQAARGQGVRCHGFQQGDWVHCSREQYAGEARFSGGSQTWDHKVEGPCPCGTEHAPAPAKAGRQQPKGEIVATYDYHNSAGELAYQVVHSSGNSHPTSGAA